MKLFILIICFLPSAYAVFDKNFPFAVDDNARVLSDSSDIAVTIKRENKNNNYFYKLNIISHEKDVESVSFEDNISYDICYVPGKGDYLVLVSSPVCPATIMIINMKSKGLMKCSLHEVFTKWEVYTAYTITSAGDGEIDVNYWHENGWRTLTEEAVLLCCENRQQSKFTLIINFQEKIIHVLPLKKKILFTPYPSLKTR